MTAIWIVGRPAAGKTTLAGRLVAGLERRGRRAVLVDSDEARSRLTPRPTYEPAERELVYRALAFAADRAVAAGAVPVIAATAGSPALDAAIRAVLPEVRVVLARCPPEVASARDPKGLYAAARRGAIGRLPGAGGPFVEPAADAVVDTGAPVDEGTVEALLDRLLGSEP